MTVLGSLTHSPSFVALHSVSHVPWLISPSSLWRRLSVSYTVSFPQSLVPGPFSSPMKSYLSGCPISPRLQSLYTHDPQSFISRTAQSSVWEPNDCCLLDTSLVSQVPQTSNFQNETTFLPKPLLFLWCPFTSMNWLVRSPSQKFGRYPWLLSLHHTHHLFSRYALCLLPFTWMHLLLFNPEILFWFMVPSSLTWITVNRSK